MRYIGILSAETRVVVSPSGDLLQCGLYLGYDDLFLGIVSIGIQTQVQDDALIVPLFCCKLLVDFSLQGREVCGLPHQFPDLHGRDC